METRKRTQDGSWIARLSNETRRKAAALLAGRYHAEGVRTLGGAVDKAVYEAYRRLEEER